MHVQIGDFEVGIQRVGIKLANRGKANQCISLLVSRLCSFRAGFGEKQKKNQTLAELSETSVVFFVL